MTPEDLIFEADWSGWAVSSRVDQDEHGDPIVLIEADSDGWTDSDLREALEESGVEELEDQDVVIQFLIDQDIEFDR